MLDVNSFVVFATPDTPSLRSFHASCDWSSRSRGRREPSAGGIVVSSGPSTSASPASHASQRGYASTSRCENWPMLSGVSCSARPSRWGTKYPPCGNTW